MAAAMSRRSPRLGLPERLARRLPRRFRERVATTLHDLRMLRGSITGETPPYLVPRPKQKPWTTPPRRPVIAFEPMSVADVIRETPDAVTLVLARPNGPPLSFDAGQFLTVEVEVGGEKLRRAYSLSSAPSDGHTTITVKRVEGGRVSNHLNDHVRPGAMLEVRGPSGDFGAPEASTPRHLVMLAGGSGITPLFSIAREVLAAEPETRVTLIYGNRSLADVIFADALEQMAADVPRFTLDRVLAEADEGFGGTVGILDRATVEVRLDALSSDGATYLVCGPEPMRAACREALAARGVDPSMFHEEVFVRPELSAAGAPLPTEKVVVQMRVGDDLRDVIVAPGRTLLEAGLSSGASLPFSCTMGGCAACKVRLGAGDVRMEEPNCLTAEERAGGYVLTCVGRPLGPCLIEVDR